MKYGFSETSPYPQPLDGYRVEQVLNGVEEDVDYLPGTHIRCWYTHLPTSFPMHWHRCMEIIEGVHSYYTCHTEQLDFQINPGDILILPAGVMHDLKPGPDCNGWLFLIDLHWLEGIPTAASLCGRLTAPILMQREAHLSQHLSVSGLLSQMRADYFSSNPNRELLFDASVLRLMDQLLSDTAEEGAARLDTRHEHNGLISQAVNYIDAHFAEGLTLNDLARQFNLSAAYFSRLFKQYTHASFSDYLLARRMQEANALLTDPSLSITEVAARCGYSSPAVFSRAFQAHRNCSPTKFRQIYASMES